MGSIIILFIILVAIMFFITKLFIVKDGDKDSDFAIIIIIAIIVILFLIKAIGLGQF